MILLFQFRERPPGQRTWESSLRRLGLWVELLFSVRGFELSQSLELLMIFLVSLEVCGVGAPLSRNLQVRSDTEI